MRGTVVPVLGLIAALSYTAAAPTKKPNIVLILTDDQDVVMGGSDRDVIPKIHELLADQGVTFHNMFATTPVCCPSRSSLVSGRMIHSIPMTNNSIPGNCSSTEWQQGAEQKSFAVYMQNAGYSTSYAGKYLNAYGEPSVGGLEYVPPGWTNWQTLQGNSRYYDYKLSNNGVAESHGTDYHDDYFTDLVTNRTLDFIKTQGDKPFFAVMATPACHDPTIAAPQYTDMFAGRGAPRLPNYGGGFSSDRNWFVKTYGALGMPEDRQNVTDWQFRRRLETLQSVESLVERTVQTLKDMGELDNTYILYTSDHGYHFGLLGLLKDKRMPYEFDIRIPLFVRGPSVPENASTGYVATMIDLFPTFLDIAGVDIPAQLEGKSFLSELSTPSGANGGAARSFLVEFSGEANSEKGGVCEGLCRGEVACYIEGPEMEKNPPLFHGETVCSPQDSHNNTYSCVRTINATDNTMYCHYDYGFIEYYDLSLDFYQRENNASLLSPEKAAAYHDLWEELSTCDGSDCVVMYE